MSAVTNMSPVGEEQLYAIRIRNLCKGYRTYEKRFDFLKEAITGKPHHTEKPVLRSINLDISPGEIVGVMGRNGAGKSTLLKVLAGTLSATSGEVEIRGKVAAILELGTGFNAAYSGRDNVIMSGLMRGLSEQQIQGRFNDIVSFAGLEAVIDDPFHTYSSGMQARLAFAVATAVDADVLIIDEALAAGDIRFAARSLSRLHEICSAGVTALFVSHVSYSVMQLCSRAVWIEDGAVVMDGDPIDVVRAYEYQMHREIAQDQGRSGSAPAGPDSGKESAADVVQVDSGQSVNKEIGPVASGEDKANSSGNDVESCNESIPAEVRVNLASTNTAEAAEVLIAAEKKAEPAPDDADSPRSDKFNSGEYRITGMHFLDQLGKQCEAVRVGESLQIVVEYECLLAELPDHSCGLAVAFNRRSDFEAIMYFNTNYPHSDEEIRNYADSPFRQGRYRTGRIVARIDPIQLRPDNYYVSYGILPNQPGPHEFYEYHHCERTMLVLANGFEEPAVFYPMVSWQHQKCSA